MSIEAMKQALEALNEVTGWQWAGPMRVMDEVDDAITSLRQAIQEEALRNVQRIGQEIEQDWSTQAAALESLREHMARIKELEAQLELMKSEKPVAWESLLGAVARGWCYEENANKTMDTELALAIAKEVSTLYTYPQPKREWVGLTDEEIEMVIDKVSREVGYYPSAWDMVSPRTLIAAVIEAAHGLKEKNT